ncbi:MAG: hypothetical protein ABJB22_04065 [Verrucomicrobiota bacterium]
MKHGIPACMFLLLAAVVHAEPLLPTATGTTWEYRMIQEMGEGRGSGNEKGNPASNAAIPIIDRIDGTQDFEGQKLFKLVRRRAGVLLSTNLIAVNERGIVIHALAGGDGQAFAVNPPEGMLATPVRVGTKWTCRTEAAGVALQGPCEITGEEDVQVSAGKFHAYRIHFAPSSAVSSSIDRWFVPAVGFVKEITTTRAPTGDLLQRTSLELQRPPTVLLETKASIGSRQLSVDVASTPEGEAATRFSSAVARVCARWRGRGLRRSAKVRVVWIAEDVGGIAPSDYKIDEATTIASEPNSHGIFTLSRPESGWAEGKYRVEFYLDEAFVEGVKVEIEK